MDCCIDTIRRAQLLALPQGGSVEYEVALNSALVVVLRINGAYLKALWLLDTVQSLGDSAASVLHLSGVVG